MSDNTKWDYDKTEHMRCGENYEVYHFLRGDDPKEWTLQEVTVYLGNIEAENVRMHGENDKLRAEVKRLKEDNERLLAAINAQWRTDCLRVAAAWKEDTNG